MKSTIFENFGRFNAVGLLWLPHQKKEVKSQTEQLEVDHCKNKQRRNAASSTNIWEPRTIINSTTIHEQCSAPGPLSATFIIWELRVCSALANPARFACQDQTLRQCGAWFAWWCQLLNRVQFNTESIVKIQNLHSHICLQFFSYHLQTCIKIGHA